MRKFNVNVNGTLYEVEVDEIQAGAAAAPARKPIPAAAPKAAAPKAAAPKAAPARPAAAPAGAALAAGAVSAAGVAWTAGAATAAASFVAVSLSAVSAASDAAGINNCPTMRALTPTQAILAPVRRSAPFIGEQSFACRARCSGCRLRIAASLVKSRFPWRHIALHSSYCLGSHMRIPSPTWGYAQ